MLSGVFFLFFSFFLYRRLVERAIVGLLRVIIRMLRREKLITEVSRMMSLPVYPLWAMALCSAQLRRSCLHQPLLCCRNSSDGEVEKNSVCLRSFLFVSLCQVLPSLQILLRIHPDIWTALRRQISFGLYELLRTCSASITQTKDWATILLLLEYTGSQVGYYECS